jgi:hypothetical protein
VNVGSGGEWKGGGIGDLAVDEATCIHIYNIFISTKM